MKLEIHNVSETLFNAWRQAVLAQPDRNEQPSIILRELVSDALRADLRQMADPDADSLAARVAALEARVNALEQSQS